MAKITPSRLMNVIEFHAKTAKGVIDGINSIETDADMMRQIKIKAASIIDCYGELYVLLRKVESQARKAALKKAMAELEFS